MSVNESITAYSTTAASNTPAGTDNIGTDLDDHLRDVKKNIRTLSNEFSAFQAQSFFSADPTLFVSINNTFTGNDPISVSGTFTSSNISVSLNRAPLISATYTGTFVPNNIDPYGRTLEFTAFSALAASKAEVDSGSGGYINASSLRAAQGVAKAYCTFDGSGTASVSMSYLIDRVTRSAAGTYVVEWGSAVGGAFTGTHFTALVEHGLTIGGNTSVTGSAEKTTTSYKFKLVRTNDGVATDHNLVGVAIFHIHWANPNAALP